MLRLTKENIQKILDMNEGFSKNTSHRSRNFDADYCYIIKGGKLIIERISETSWADSLNKVKEIADIEQTRRFINKYLHLLNLGDLLPGKGV